MRGLAVFLVCFLLLGFESPLLQQLDVARYAPDLVLVTVFYVGLTTRFEVGLLLALMLGLCKDGFTGGAPVGLYTEIAVVTFLVIFKLSRRLVLRNAISVMLVTALLSLGSGVLEMILATVFDRTFGQGDAGAGLVLATMLPQALITAPFAPVIFALLDRVDGWTTRRRDSVFP